MSTIQGTKIFKAIKDIGIKDFIKGIIQQGRVTEGKLMGVDKYGNKYYENMESLQQGKNRWVLYNKLWNTHTGHNASQVPPEWHPWLHYTTNKVPGKFNIKYEKGHSPMREAGTKLESGYLPSGHYLRKTGKFEKKQSYESWKPKSKKTPKV